MLPGMSEQSPDSKSPSKRQPRKEAEAPTAKAVIESPRGHVVGGDETDPVYESKLVADPNKRKSLTVHHVQRRLVDVGYHEAAAGIDGQYDVHTQRAFEAWQSDNGFDPGPATFDQFQELFNGDPNVTVLRG